jgi:hypothetical protein
LLKNDCGGPEMKKPSADERADASRLFTVAGHIALVGEPPCPGGQVGEGVSPTLNVRTGYHKVTND